jgi:CTP synthase (UTP-ammonia lyase)
MSGKGFIIGSSGPILKQIEYIITLRKIDTILGLLKGF